MQIRSPELFLKLEKLAAHYTNNVASQHIKSEFSLMTLSQRDWDEVELITARQEIFRQQGYHLDELYTKLLALARFVRQGRTILAPRMRTLVANRYAGRPASEKLMADMATANFLPNLAVLADMVLDLFNLVKREDAAQNHGRNKALASVPEAKDIENLLG